MNKKSLGNGLMIIAIGLMLIGGTLFVGHAKGWFATEPDVTIQENDNKESGTTDKAMIESAKQEQETLDEEVEAQAPSTVDDDVNSNNSASLDDSMQQEEQQEPGSETQSDTTKSDQSDKEQPIDNVQNNQEDDIIEPHEAGSCTIEIRCDTVFNNWNELNKAKTAYIPDDGVILKTTTVNYKANETVYDVLKRTCTSAGIAMESSDTSIYGVYIEGINQLYEQDCGSQSGWVYLVNGQTTNLGCSSYVLSTGDIIVWAYSCKGYGEDVTGLNN